MSLTGNFDYCVQMGIQQVREIFHLAFKSEDRYPHNIGPIEHPLPGERVVMVNVRVHDDESRPAELHFEDLKHMRFSFPFDLTVETEDAPDPELSRVTMQVRVEVLGLLTAWDEEGEDVLGISFEGIVPAQVDIIELEGLPTIDINNINNAIHNKYDEVPHVYNDAASGSTLIIYDDARDGTLTPPNHAMPADIVAVLENHGGTDYLKVTLPLHVSINLPGGSVYNSYGTIVFWRTFEQTDTLITVNMSIEPADSALATQVNLDNVTDQKAAETAEIRAAIHDKYDTAPTHTYSIGGNTLTVYNGNADATLYPPNANVPSTIEAALETHGSVEYLRVQLPIHASVPLALGFQSYGHIIFYREVQRPNTTELRINFANTPADPALATDIVFTSPDPGGLVEMNLLPFTSTTIAAFGTVTGPSFGVVLQSIRAQAVTAINNFGIITEPAISESAARTMLQEEIAAYLVSRRYPMYSPKSGDETEPLFSPVGFLLIEHDVLAVMMNRRFGTPADDEVPDHFLGASDFALATSRAKIFEYVDDTVDELFPGLDGSGGSYSGSHYVETDDGDATLKSLNISLADPGQHDVSEGHFWITGEAEVHIDCWPDPDVDFDGPVFLDSTTGVDADGNCTFNIDARPGDFDVDQSCCSCIINWLIPIVGPIMHFVIENTVEDVGGELIDDYVEGQARHMNAIPPVVNGIAEIIPCLTDALLQSGGLILPGTMTVRRLGRSFEDLEAERDTPRP